MKKRWNSCNYSFNCCARILHRKHTVFDINQSQILEIDFSFKKLHLFIIIYFVKCNSSYITMRTGGKKKRQWKGIYILMRTNITTQSVSWSMVMIGTIWTTQKTLIAHIKRFIVLALAVCFNCHIRNFTCMLFQFFSSFYPGSSKWEDSCI